MPHPCSKGQNTEAALASECGCSNQGDTGASTLALMAGQTQKGP